MMVNKAGLPPPLTKVYGKEIRIYQHHWQKDDLVGLAYKGGTNAIGFLPPHHRMLFEQDVPRLAHEGTYQGEYLLGQVDHLGVLATRTFYGMFKRMARDDNSIADLAAQRQLELWMNEVATSLPGPKLPSLGAAHLRELLLEHEDLVREPQEYLRLFIQLLGDKSAVSIPILEYFAGKKVIKPLLMKRGDDQALIVEQMTHLEGDFYSPDDWLQALTNFKDAHPGQR